MNNGVFYKRLQAELGDQRVQNIFIILTGDLEFMAVPDLLNMDIGLYQPDFIF
ncbi:hypothetical protein D3C86_1856060 [compost metagenome]